MEIPYTTKTRPDTGLYNAKVGIWLFLASEVMLFGALFSAYILLRVGSAPGEWPHHPLNIWLGMTNTFVLICSSITVVLAWASLKMNQFGKYKMYQAITLLCALGFMVIKTIEYKDKFTHYYVQTADGKGINGHISKIDGKEVHSPMFLTLAKLQGQNATSVEVHPDPVVDEHGKHGEHPEPVTFQLSEVKKLESWGPWRNTYFAIYFVLTGLHALHVIGGALVIFMIWGPLAGMWKTDPERYTNRIEISGLFWHFVDLVWIFLFPVLYLLT